MSSSERVCPYRTHGLRARDCRGLRPRVHEQQFPAGDRRAGRPLVQTEPATDLSTPAAAGLRPLAVANVTVDVGVGSPIPVDAFVSGEWP